MAMVRSLAVRAVFSESALTFSMGEKNETDVASSPDWTARLTGSSAVLLQPVHRVSARAPEAMSAAARRVRRGFRAVVFCGVFIGWSPSFYA